MPLAASTASPASPRSTVVVTACSFSLDRSEFRVVVVGVDTDHAGDFSSFRYDPPGASSVIGRECMYWSACPVRLDHTGRSPGKRSR